MKKLLTIIMLLITVGVFGQTAISVILPQYIQGVGSNNDADDKRLPYVSRVTLTGLIPNHQYRYFNRFADNIALTGDANIDNGKGNMIIPSTGGNFERKTSLNLSSANSSGLLTTDANGSYTGWFIAEPTENNLIFKPGSVSYWRIMLNDNPTANQVTSRLTIPLPITVLGWDGYDPYSGQGLPLPPAGFEGSSLVGGLGNPVYLPKNLVFLYDNIAGTGRPLSGTYVESDGLSNTINLELYADFYEAIPIDGANSYWGAIIPASTSLGVGVRNIRQFSLASGNAISECTDADAIWDGVSTVAQIGQGFDHTNPIVIDCTPNTLTCNLSVTGAVTNVACFGQTNGAINVTVTGATAPITYNWSNGATTEDLTGLTGGSYTLVVVDAKGCNDTATFVVNQPVSAIAASAAATNILCFGQTSGSINLTVTGGTLPYTYAWTGPGGFTSTNEDLSGLAAGTYNVTVTDATGCTATASAIIVQPAQLTISVLAPPIPNCGTSTTVSVSASGGTAPITGAGTFTNVAPGTYTYTVTDANGCTASQTITIAAAPCVTVAEVIYPQFMQGAGTGSAVNDRKVPYACRLSLGGLNPGATYRFFSRFVTDPNDQTNGVGNFIVVNQSGSFTRVTNAALGTAGGYGEFTANGSGNYTGWFVVEATQDGSFQPGTPLYFRLVLNDGAGGGSVANRVTYSTNTVSVINFGTTATDGSFVWGATNPFWTAKNFVMLYNNIGGTGRPISGTFIEDDGTANTAVNGYVPAYETNVNAQASRWGTIIPNNLTSGINNISQYSLAAGALVNACTSGNGQYGNINQSSVAGTTSTANANWGETAVFNSANPQNILCTDCSLSLSSTKTDVLCFGATTGAINLTVNGASGSVNISWTGPGGFTATTEDISGLAAGAYTVVVTQVSNPSCTATATITITQPATAVSASSIATTATCGNANGSVNLTATGGTTAAAIQLLSQNFDGMGSSATAATPANFRVSAGTDWAAGTVATTVAYGTTGTGAVGAASAGGTVNWANGVTATSTDRSLGFLTSGTFTSPRSIILKIDNTTGATITQLNISFDYEKYRNGQRAYDWTFFHGSTTSPATAASAGNQSYGVDAGNTVVNPPTTINKTVTLTGLSIPNAGSYYIRWTMTGLAGSTNSQGLGVDNISISVPSANPYSYAWTGPGGFTATTEDISNVIPGTYTAIVTDANGCTATTNATVGNVAGPTVTASSTPVTTVGGSDGTATATVTGGTSPFTYSWAPGGQTTQTATGLIAGTYTVTVTDANGCTATATTTVTAPTCSLAATAAAGTIACNGGTTTLTVTATGGTGALQYSINGGAFQSSNAFTVIAGTYTATVREVANPTCSATATAVTINQPAQLVAAESHTAILCFGGSSTVTISAIGGTAPYTGTGTFTQVAGTQSYTVTDANGCTSLVSVTVSQPTQLVAAESHTAILCFGGSSTVTISATGGTAPYTGTGTFTRTAGTYSFTVTDANGCTSLVSVTISQPTQLVAAESHTAILCFGGSSTVTISATGGTAPYTGTGTFTRTAGTYSFTVTDANGCTSSVSVTISQPTALTASASSTPVTVIGGSNGTATATPAGGTSPYTYVWAPGGQTTQTATGLTAGTYTVTVTDANGCTATATTTVGSPACNVTLSFAKTNVLCFGASTGTATVTAANTTGTVTYLWSNGQTTATATGLAAGTYSVTVTDGSGCTASGSVTISQPSAALVAAESHTAILCFGGSSTVTISATGGTAPYTGTGTFTRTAGTYSFTVTDANGCTSLVNVTVSQPTAVTASASSTPVTVIGGSNGTATATPAGGTSPYTYVWAPGGQTTQTATGLTAGTYTVTVTDANGCVATATTTVGSPACNVTLSFTKTNVLCFGASTGAATVTAANTTGTVTYLWSNGQTTATATGLAAGTYSVTVTDGSGCTASGSVTISQPSAALVAAESHTAILCFGGSSTVTISAAGGTAPYTGTGTFTRTAGTYSFTVTDANGCTSLVSVTISQPTQLVAAESHTAILCFGGSSTVTISATGGTAPYTGTGTFTRTAGTYSFTVTDANGCTSSVSVTIAQPTALTATASSTPVTVIGGSNGTATATPAGGTSPYTYVWAPGGQTTQTATGLTAGTYTVTVTDANGCTATATTTVGSPACNVTLSFAQTNVSCFGGNNGSIDLTVTGAIAPVTYSWSNGATTQDISGLTAGTYSVSVTDGSGCTVSGSVTISQPSTALVAAESHTAILCFGGSSTVTISATGGTAPYTGTGTFTQAAGTQSYTVMDANECSSTVTVTVSQPAAALVASAVGTGLTCATTGNNGTVALTVSGGTSPYTYLWSNGATTQNLSALAAGTYSVTVTDANGCTATASAVIIPRFAATIAITNAPCGYLTGTVTITATGGVAPYTYAGPGTAAGGGVFNNVPFGNVSYTATDASGCVRTVTGRVAGPLVASSLPGIIPCGSTTTTVTVTASQGVAPYTGTGTFTVPAGPYSFIVTDANGCTATTSGVVAAPTCYTVTPVYYPKYVQGAGTGSPSDDRKVPYAARMTVGGLTGNTTYRYYSRFTDNPSDNTNGVGTYIIVDAGTGTFTRVTSASLSTAGRYGEFTTDASGNYTGWFVAEPSADGAFQPGNQLYWRMMINDGAGGGSVIARITATESVSVLGFGSTSTQGTGVRGSNVPATLTAKNL